MRKYSDMAFIFLWVLIISINIVSEKCIIG